MSATYVDLTGTRIGRLIVLRRSDKSTAKRPRWVCACDCGRVWEGRMDALRSGATSSCGCLQKERQKEAVTRHGKSGSRAYHTWQDMQFRCNDSRHASYHNYGARGITVCSEWSTFATFYRDMGDPPQGLSLDRIDNSQGYSKDNCRWASWSQQSRNRRTNHVLTHEGMTAPLVDWAASLGLHPVSLANRINRGWSLDRALTQKRQESVRSQ